jgi:hypothetical protein
MSVFPLPTILLNFIFVHIRTVSDVFDGHPRDCKRFIWVTEQAASAESAIGMSRASIT